jgi:hypothetical protein
MFCGIIIIHRTITYFPTYYSDFKYEAMSLRNVILSFLVIILSIQIKLGIKTNIMYDARFRGSDYTYYCGILKYYYYQKIISLMKSF